MPETFLNSDPSMRPVSGRPGQLEKIPCDSPGVLRVWGEAEVRNGPGTCMVPGCGCRQLHFRARNKIVGTGLRHLVNMALGVYSSLTNVAVMNQYLWPPLFETNNASRSRVQIGSGVGATQESTTSLLAPNGTLPNNLVVAYDNPSAGVYRVKFTATWNSGTLGAVTVTEIGVFGYLQAGGVGTQPNLGPQPGNFNGSPAAMFARLSSVDNEFAPFVVNPAVPLAIEYRIVYTYT